MITISESWLLSSIADSELFDSRYTVYRRDRDYVATRQSLGGGVAIAVKRSLRSSCSYAWQSSAEDIWVTISYKDLVRKRILKLHICTIYLCSENLGHSFSRQLYNFTNQLTNLFSTHSDDLFLVLGDFNMSDITWLSSANDFLIPSGLSGDHVYNFIDTLSLCNLNQYNNILNNFGRLLDLVLSNKNVSVKECLDPLVPEDPHHKALLIDIALSTTTPLPINPHTLYSYSRADYTNIKKSVREINWHDKLSSHDLNTAVDLFYSTLYSIRDKYVPTRRAGNESYPPWFNSALVKILKEKHKYYKKFKTYSNISDELSFKTLRDRAKKVENECYANYIRSIESAIVQNPKAFWSYVKSKREGSSVPSSVSYAGVTSDTGPGISELFSSYFHSTFIQNNISNNNPYPSDILSVCDISSIEVRTGEIERFLKSLDLSKSAGPDELPAVFLSNCASELTVPIAILFSRSLTEGVVPLRWKLAFISPIHKKGSKDQVGNYRPISKLCLIAKVLERIVFNQLYNRLKSAFSPAQHGFLKGRSTVSNLVIFNDFITEEMDSNNNQVATIYTDYSKAFDRIDHYLLLQKLHIIGVRGHLLDWFRSYLNNRKQAVVLNGFTSSWRSIPSGVPQGSLLGPLLFIIFINDIDTCFINSNYLLFADDMKIFRKVNNSLDEALLQDDLQRLDQYCTNNSLDLNVDKCYFIVFTRKRKPFMCSFKIKNQSLNQVYSTKDLGVTHDSKLLFDSHIDNIVGKASRAMGFIMRVSKPFKSMKTLKILYCSYVRSHLEYASQIWNPKYETYINRLERVQKKFTRFLGFKFKLPKMCYQTRCSNMHFLSLQNRREIADVLFLAKLVKGNIDCPALLSKVGLRVPPRLTRLKPLLNVPTSKTNYRQNSFLIRACRTFNKHFTGSDIDLFCNSLSSMKHHLINVCC